MRKAFIFPALIAAGRAAQSCQQKNQEKTWRKRSRPTLRRFRQSSFLQRPHGWNHFHGCTQRGRHLRHRERRTCNRIPLYGETRLLLRPQRRTVEQHYPAYPAHGSGQHPTFHAHGQSDAGIHHGGTYNAADLFVYANDTLWQKFAFEQDERGNHRIVTVRTQGTSDDNNHERLTVPSVYLKISSDTHTIASYYSLDQKEWQMVRLYKNYYPDKIWVGIASQCPRRASVQASSRKSRCNRLP